MVAKARRCRAKTASGKPCQATARPSGFCTFHCPQLKRKRDAGRRAGGRRRARPAVVLPVETATVPLATIADVCGLLATTINQVRTGALDVKVSNAVGYLAAILVRVIEGHVLELQVQELRQMVEAGQHRAPAWEPAAEPQHGPPGATSDPEEGKAA